MFEKIDRKKISMPDDYPNDLGYKYSAYKKYTDLFDKAKKSKDDGTHNDDYWVFNALVTLLAIDLQSRSQGKQN